MKKCNYCGFENPDDAVQCGTCQTALMAPPQTTQLALGGQYVNSPDEQRFWERMTFRQFAILMVRLQAVWLLFEAVIEVTYLPRYFTRVRGALNYTPLYRELNSDLFLAILRIILHVAAALALIQFAERVLSWLVKDAIPKQTPTDLPH